MKLVAKKGILHYPSSVKTINGESGPAIVRTFSNGDCEPIRSRAPHLENLQVALIEDVESGLVTPFDLASVQFPNGIGVFNVFCSPETEERMMSVAVTPAVTKKAAASSKKAASAKAKAPAKKAEAKKATKSNGKASSKSTKKTEKKAETKKAPAYPRTLKVGKADWKIKKVAILETLRGAKEGLTKKQIAAVIQKKYGMSDHLINAYCWELTEAGYVHVYNEEGQGVTNLREATAKGRKLNLPKIEKK